jgi:hypothetical protein
VTRRSIPPIRWLSAPAIIWFSCLTAAAAAHQQPGDRPPVPATAPATLTGRLTVGGERDTPVRRARITLESDALPQPQLADSDSDGRFRFDRLPAGTFRLRAEKPGFVTLAFGARHALDRGLPIDLRAGQTRSVELALPRGAALDGRVMNQEGDPIQNLVVSAVRLTYGPYGRQPMPLKDTRTDDLGRYRIHSLPPGDYYVQAAPDPIDAVSERQAPGPRPPGAARTYYPGAAMPSDAERVSLVAGREATSLDFTVASVPMARVTLQVVDTTGKAPRTLGTRLQRVGAPPGEVRGVLQANQAMFPGVPPGEYWAMAAATPSPGADPEFAAVRVTVSGSDLNLTLATARGTVLNGRVQVEGGEVATTSGLRVGADTVGYELPNPSGSGAPAAPGAAVGADGRFVIAGLFGPRLFRVGGLKDGWALSSVRLGESDITDTPMDVKPADPAVELVLVVTNDTGTIGGMLTDARKRAVPNGRVVVFSDDERQWTARSRFLKASLAGVDGSYSVGSLLPGKYLVCAVDWLDDGAWFDPDVLRRLRAFASPISVKGHDRQTIALTLGELR